MQRMAAFHCLLVLLGGIIECCELSVYTPVLTGLGLQLS